MSLPQGLNLSMMQNRWATYLDPLLKNPLSLGIFVDAQLSTGNNIINHRLGRTPQGWIICDIDASSSIYRSADFNNLTLTLNSSADCNIKIYVF